MIRFYNFTTRCRQIIPTNKLLPKENSNDADWSVKARARNYYKRLVCGSLPLLPDGRASIEELSLRRTS